MEQADLAVRKRAITSAIERLDAELDTAYEQIVRGRHDPTAPSSREALTDIVSKSRKLKDELEHERLALIRIDRQIARERQLRQAIVGAKLERDEDLPPSDQPDGAPGRRKRKSARSRSSAASFPDRSQRLAFEELARCLDDNSPEVRREAVIRLGEVESLAALELLNSALEDPNDRVRIAALNSIANTGGSASVAIFRRFVNDRDPLIRTAALRGLGRVGAEAATPTLVDALEDEDPNVRLSVTTTLGWRLGEPVITPLILVLRDNDEHVRAAAADALGNHRDDRAVLSLIRAIADKSSSVSESARRALRAIIGDHVDTIAAGEDPEQRVAALKKWWRRARVSLRVDGRPPEPSSDRVPPPAPANVSDDSDQAEDDAGGLLDFGPDESAGAADADSDDSDQAEDDAGDLLDFGPDESVGAADESIGAADESIGAADESIGAADESVGAADESIGAADESIGAKDESIGAADESGEAKDENAEGDDKQAAGFESIWGEGDDDSAEYESVLDDKEPSGDQD